MKGSLPTRPPAEQVVVAAVLSPDSQALEASDPLAEIEGLAVAAGAQVVGRVIQRRPKPHVRTAFGPGKIEEIAALCKARHAKVLVVDLDLSPSQGRNLEKDLDLRVIDRTELILDIFANRARSRQAKLQVELAQLQYLRSRLQRMWTHLERTGGGIGTRGPGETQLETDRRIIGQKISDLKRRLAHIEERSRRRAEDRLDPNTVSLVGYTNAGKSSLLVELTGANAYVADQLFATLDTRVRHWKLGDGRVVMLADTVGFVRELPHHLVASFHATLEETLHADLLLHVLDASDPDRMLNLRAVDQVLQELGAGEIPTLLVLNKADLLDEAERIAICAEFPEAVLISVNTREGVADLDAAIAAQLDAWSLHMEVSVPSGAGKLVSDLQRVSRIENEHYEGSDWKARLRIGPRHWGMLQNEFDRVGADFLPVSG
ncbi:MAG: GTPase HflX [Planctomycetes bacterium]|nr:GTPase HflX [Planctomycetota bacterium]